MREDFDEEKKNEDSCAESLSMVNQKNGDQASKVRRGEGTWESGGVDEGRQLNDERLDSTSFRGRWLGDEKNTDEIMMRHRGQTWIERGQ